MRKPQSEIILDDSDLMDFVERTSAEDRARGSIEPLAIDFKKLAEAWKERKKLDKGVLAEPLVVWAQLVGDKLELSLQNRVPGAPLSVHANEIRVGNLRIAIVLSQTEIDADVR